VLYLALTGRYPFESEQRHGTLRAHLMEPVVPPSQRIERPIPSDVEAIVMPCLDKDPEARFHDARALATALTSSSVAGLHRPALGPRPSPASVRAEEIPTEEIRVHARDERR
jgi:serine/threonine protein kinase